MSDLTLAELLTTAKALRQEKRNLEAKTKEVGHSLEEINHHIMNKMHAEGIERTSLGDITVSLSKQTLFNITDYETFTSFLIENRMPYLLQKRASNPAIRELIASGVEVPGLTAFEKEQLNMRVTNT